MHHAVRSAVRSSLTVSVLALAALSFGACGPGTHGGDDDDDGSVVDDARPVDAPDVEGPPYGDFPMAPIVEGGASSDGFDQPGSASGGPCLLETEVGSLLPRGWLRPRFRWTPTHQVYELTLEAATQQYPLHVYTTQTTWTMPASIWTALQAHTVSDPIRVTVRGLDTGGAPATGSSGPIQIAPVAISGSIVYWTNTGTPALKGFSVGEETVHPVLTSAQAGGQCLGCHNSTPDGEWLGFSLNAAATDGRPSWAAIRKADGSAAAPTFISASAGTLLARTYQQEPVFSAAHWAAGDRIALSMFETGGRTEIIWTNLEATTTTQGTGWGIVARTGGPTNAGGATWSNDGNTVAYIAANYVSSGINTDQGGADIYTVPYNGGAGGTATALAGAATAEYSESFPDFSQDDKLVAFTRVPPTLNSYDEPQAEVFVVPTTGGTAVRLAANNPPTCSGATSPGVGNSWPKWSPEVTSVAGSDYYWLTFSSKRGGGVPQLYVSPVVVSGTNVTTYPALYLWNQPATESNHTPAWDTFDIIGFQSR